MVVKPRQQKVTVRFIFEKSGYALDIHTGLSSLKSPDRDRGRGTSVKTPLDSQNLWNLERLRHTLMFTCEGGILLIFFNSLAILIGNIKSVYEKAKQPESSYL